MSHRLDGVTGVEPKRGHCACCADSRARVSDLRREVKAANDRTRRVIAALRAAAEGQP